MTDKCDGYSTVISLKQTILEIGCYVRPIQPPVANSRGPGTDLHWLPEDHFRANGVTNINDQVFPQSSVQAQIATDLILATKFTKRLPAE